jgi:hypothetical protein
VALRVLHARESLVRTGHIRRRRVQEDVIFPAMTEWALRHPTRKPAIRVSGRGGFGGNKQQEWVYLLRLHPNIHYRIYICVVVTLFLLRTHNSDSSRAYGP